MGITNSWKKFGTCIEKYPRESLFAFLGNLDSIDFLSTRNISFPSESDFRLDPDYDPDPFSLDLDKTLAEGKFLLLCLATWGPHVVKSVAGFYATKHFEIMSSKKIRRSEVLSVCKLAIDKHRSLGVGEKPQDLQECLNVCRDSYRPYEKNPDSKKAIEVWSELGSVWFMLEILMSDFNTGADYGEINPGPSNSTWINRNTVWVCRSFDSLVDHVDGAQLIQMTKVHLLNHFNKS